MASQPLTDEQFGVLADRLLRWLKPTGEDSATLRLWLEQIFTDARLHRAELAKARAEIERLREALDAIARGMVPPGVMNDLENETPLSFRTKMWDWSQKTARAALAPEGEGG